MPSHCVSLQGPITFSHSVAIPNTPFTQSSKHRAIIEQTSSKNNAYIKHSHTKQTSSKHQAIGAHVVHVYFKCICWMFAR